jgi:hypothetical protein
MIDTEPNKKKEKGDKFCAATLNSLIGRESTDTAVTECCTRTIEVDGKEIYGGLL